MGIVLELWVWASIANEAEMRQAAKVRARISPKSPARDSAFVHRLSSLLSHYSASPRTSSKHVPSCYPTLCLIASSGQRHPPGPRFLPSDPVEGRLDTLSAQEGGQR